MRQDRWCYAGAFSTFEVMVPNLIAVGSTARAWCHWPYMRSGRYPSYLSRLIEYGTLRDGNLTNTLDHWSSWSVQSIFTDHWCLDWTRGCEVVLEWLHVAPSWVGLKYQAWFLSDGDPCIMSELGLMWQEIRLRSVHIVLLDLPHVMCCLCGLQYVDVFGLTWVSIRSPVSMDGGEMVMVVMGDSCKGIQGSRLTDHSTSLPLDRNFTTVSNLRVKININ